MKSLPPDWLTSGLLDAEYKKYLLLAYLKHVSGTFEKGWLYPSLGEVIEHHRNLVEIRERWEDHREELSKELIAIDPQKRELVFRPHAESESLTVLREVLEYALPRLDQKRKEGKDIYDLVERNLEIDIVGIEPLYKREGYFLLTMEREPSVRAYKYRFQLFSSDHERWIGLETQYLFSDLRRSNPPGIHWKKRLVRNFPELPNPLIFRVHSQLNFATNETLLPIAKRLLIPRIAA